MFMPRGHKFFLRTSRPRPSSLVHKWLIKNEKKFFCQVFLEVVVG
jgi:hypothetical protein